MKARLDYHWLLVSWIDLLGVVLRSLDILFQWSHLLKRLFLARWPHVGGLGKKIVELSVDYRLFDGIDYGLCCLHFLRLALPAFLREGGLFNQLRTESFSVAPLFGIFRWNISSHHAYFPLRSISSLGIEILPLVILYALPTATEPSTLAGCHLCGRNQVKN